MTDFVNTHKYDNDLISVIVPVYNCEKYLRRCVESIINQSYNNIETILINDGSTDNSGDLCDAYALSNNRTRVIHTQNNGPAAARNIGIKHSKGSFIFFIDADDYVENDALELLIEHYTQHKADIIAGDFNRIKDGNIDKRNDITFSSNKLLTKQDIIDYSRCYLKHPNRFLLFAFSWGRLFKTSIIKENNILFNIELHTYEDLAFTFDYLKYTNNLFFLKEVLYNYSIHDNYTSATFMIGDNPQKLFGYKQALLNIGEFLGNCNSDADIRKEVGHADVYLTIIQLVRTCGQINNSNKHKIYILIKEIISDSHFRGNLQFYSPSKGDSMILPILMKLKLVWLIILVCKYKALKRYGKRGAVK